MKKVKGVWKQARTIGGKVGNIGIPTLSAVRRWDLLYNFEYWNSHVDSAVSPFLAGWR